ncbi:hypothetical protein WR25_23541 [Diploscapter pachys]|uniref:Uncharacterized protein n=1 Tax=Diploscapter pachys TaxID=2018661 RepID=A0A2A2JWD9_9BILA|nr:hypothetical protein WR25_23541 [Diploscapter pachys]
MSRSPYPTICLISPKLNFSVRVDRIGPHGIALLVITISPPVASQLFHITAMPVTTATFGVSHYRSCRSFALSSNDRLIVQPSFSTMQHAPASFPDAPMWPPASVVARPEATRRKR